MKRLLIHIGTPKTGTTTIQKAFHFAQLSRQLSNCTYPDFGDIAHHSIGFACRSIQRMPRGAIQKYVENPGLKTKDDLVTQIKFKESLDNGENFILSSEYFSTMNIKEIKTLRKMLKTEGLFEDTAICVYVRSPISLYTSVVQQKIKASTDLNLPHGFHYKFRKIIENWSTVFNGNIHVRPFARDLLKSSDVVQDFSCFCAEYFNIDPFIIPNVTRTNESLSTEALHILRQYRREHYANQNDVVLPDSNKLAELLLQIKTIDCNTKLTLKPGIAEVVYEQHEADVLWLFDNFGIDFRMNFTESEKRHTQRMREGLDKTIKLNGDLELNDVFTAPDTGAIQKLLLALLKNIL